MKFLIYSDGFETSIDNVYEFDFDMKTNSLLLRHTDYQDHAKATLIQDINKIKGWKIE